MLVTITPEVLVPVPCFHGKTRLLKTMFFMYFWVFWCYQIFWDFLRCYDPVYVYIASTDCHLKIRADVVSSSQQVTVPHSSVCARLHTSYTVLCSSCYQHALRCVYLNTSDILTTLKSRSQLWSYCLTLRFRSQALRYIKFAYNMQTYI